MRSAIATVLVTLAAAASVSAHGYLSSPPPRGIEKASYQIDSLKSPNNAGLCRGEPEGPIHNVVGNQVTLGFTITAPHTGGCAVHLLDESLREITTLDEKYDCAATGRGEDWTVTIPPTIKGGHYVLRWTWEGCHVSPCEPYEQCVDIAVGGGGSTGGAKSDTDTPSPKPKPVKSNGSKPKPLPVEQYEPAPLPVDQYEPAPAPAPSGDGACAPGAFTCNGARVGQCAAGQWIWTTCNAGTQCTTNGYTHYCA